MKKRSYGDGCAAAHALELVGERWALLIVRELTLGPRRFTDLRAGLPAISPNVLTQRLEELEASRILERRKLAPPSGAWVYELTEWGAELEPLIRELGRWAANSPNFAAGKPMSVSSVVLSLRTMFEPKEAQGFNADISLRFGEERFVAEVAHGRMILTRGEIAKPDALIEGDQNAFAAVVYGGRSLTEAVRAGELRTVGDRAAIKRFLRLFPLREASLYDRKQPASGTR